MPSSLDLKAPKTYFLNQLRSLWMIGSYIDTIICQQFFWLLHLGDLYICVFGSAPHTGYEVGGAQMEKRDVT